MDQVNPTPPPVAAAAPADTSLHFLDYWRIIRIRKTVILAVFLLIVVTATLVTFILPKSYASAVRLKVEGDVMDVSPMGDRFQSRAYDPYFLSTEFELMQSALILNEVIDGLNLNTRWAPRFNAGNQLKTQESLKVLKSKINVRPFRSTSLIEIEVVSENPEEAAEIANKIADVYKKYREKDREELSSGGQKSLKGQIEEQDLKIQTDGERVSNLRSNLNISDAEISTLGNGGGSLIEVETLRRANGLRIEFHAAFERELQLYTKLTNLPPAQLPSSILTAMQEADPVLQTALQELNFAQTKLVTMNNELGVQNPALPNLRAQIADLEDKVSKSVQGKMNGLWTRVETYRAQLETLEADVEKAKEADMSKQLAAMPYFYALRQFEQDQRFREALILKLSSEKVDAAIPKTSMVRITDTAEVNKRAVRPNKPFAIIAGVIVGLVVGVGLAFFIEYLDTSVKTIDEVERALQAPVLGVIPQNVGYLIKEGAESSHAEAYRVLRTNLLFARKDEKLSSIVVVSAGAGEGKSTTVFNLATIFAMHGSRVIVVDSDLRRPTIHKIMGVSNAIGMTNFLLKQNTLEEVIQTTSIPTLDIMPSGKLPSSSMGILNSKAMRNLVTELKQRYDFVLFDSPPMVGLSDASILCSEMDLTVQVIQYRRYPQPMTIRAKQMIEKVGGRLVGIVLNNINMSQDEYYYYYSGYYGGYYGDYYSKKDDDAGAGESGSGKKGKVEIKQKY